MARESGRLPPALQKAPETPPHLEWVLTAFWELSNNRQAGFSGGEPITTTEIKDYAEIHEVEELRDFKHLIREWDAEYRKVSNEKAKARRNSGNSA